MQAQAEADRLRSLKSYHVLDTVPDAAFDRLTSLAAELFDTPIALVSLVDEQRQWFKSHYGVEASETRGWAFCAHAIDLDAGSVMVVEDAARDPRFQANPLVVGDPHIRFYAGAVLTGSDGYNLGTLCIIDRKPRPTLTPKEQQRLRTLAQVVVDELELQRARLECSEKEALLDLAERMSGLGRWRYDVADGKITWSDEVFRIHGMPVGGEAPDVQAALSRYHEQDRKTLSGLFHDALATGRGYQSETRIRRADGELRHVTSKAECILDEAGAVEAVIGVFQDVTEQVRAARFLEAVADNVPGLIAYWDGDLKCRFANKGYEDWLGLAHGQVVGMDVRTIMGEASFAQNEPLIQAALQGERQTFERTLTSLTGERVHVLANLIPDIGEDGGEDGRARGVFVLVTDVTVLKQSEFQLKHVNRLLAEARDQAEAAAAAKGEFLDDLTRQIRTPLTSIVDNARALKAQSDLDTDAQQRISRVTDTGEALLAIVNDLLRFSRQAAKDAAEEPPPIDFADVWRDSQGAA